MNLGLIVYGIKRMAPDERRAQLHELLSALPPEILLEALSIAQQVAAKRGLALEGLEKAPATPVAPVEISLRW